MLEVGITLLDDEAKAPSYAHPGDAGGDLYAHHDAVVPARGGRVLVGTGVTVAIPEGYAGFVQPRSGLALNHGVSCLNSPGLIDSGYRGEIKVLLINTDPDREFTVSKGDRIAQLVIQHVERVAFTVVDEHATVPTRGVHGFGSSGR